MSTTDPITPPPELVQQWASESLATQHLCTQAARWGADQELEAFQSWLTCKGYRSLASDLLALRRRKPPSLKEQALEAQRRMWSGASNHDDWDLVRSALEQLPDAL